MVTKVSNTKMQPEIVMDKLHVDTVTFAQRRETNPKRTIAGAGVLYGIDENNEKVFDKDGFAIKDNDIDSTVIKAALEAGKTIEEFATEYYTAKATVTNKINNGQMSDGELMAYFEAALARIFELHGKISVSSVE